MVHHAIKRTSWIILALLTRCCFEIFHEVATESFFLPSHELLHPNAASPSSRKECQSCKKARIKENEKWRREARVRGYRTALGTFLWKAKTRREKAKIVLGEMVLAGAVGAGCWGMWRTRGVWGWEGIPVGLVGWGILDWWEEWVEGGYS
ncbi:hypothetical protein CJF30_00010782 [Rutstroemia sp. NJR-2017a BBW]|nr:hypothetical protein CJF30_00010782 [Rutstroemia sp. NJR-2017a BBW]